MVTVSPPTWMLSLTAVPVVLNLTCMSEPVSVIVSNPTRAALPLTSVAIPSSVIRRAPVALVILTPVSSAVSYSVPRNAVTPDTPMVRSSPSFPKAKVPLTAATPARFRSPVTLTVLSVK